MWCPNYIESASLAQPHLELTLHWHVCVCVVVYSTSKGTGRVGPSGNPDLSFDAHVAHAHGGPSRHGPRAVREHGANSHGSLSGIRTFRSGTGRYKLQVALAWTLFAVHARDIGFVLSSCKHLFSPLPLPSGLGQVSTIFTLPLPICVSVSTEIFTVFFFYLPV